MNLIITVITKTSLMKWAFGYSFIMPILAFFEQQFTGESFLTKILNAIPSKIVVILGIIYGVALVAKQLSSTYTSYQMNRLTVKQKKEELKQEEINTNIKRKDLHENTDH